MLLMVCEIKDFKISHRYCIIDLERLARPWCHSGTTRQNIFHEFSKSFQIGLIPPLKSVKYPQGNCLDWTGPHTALPVSRLSRLKL